MNTTKQGGGENAVSFIFVKVKALLISLTCSSSTSPALSTGTTITGCVGSTNWASATPTGVSTSPSSVGSHPSAAS